MFEEVHLEHFWQNHVSSYICVYIYLVSESKVCLRKLYHSYLVQLFALTQLFEVVLSYGFRTVIAILLSNRLYDE